MRLSLGFTLLSFCTLTISLSSQAEDNKALAHSASPSKVEAKFSEEISGKITIPTDLEKTLGKPGAALPGTLFIFAKKQGADFKGPNPPLAVLRVTSPKFPVDFNLSAKNVMMAGTTFTGPMHVVARYSKSGDPLDKSGPEGSTTKSGPVNPGVKNLSIELKAKN